MMNVKLPKTVKLKTYVATTLVLTVLLLASVGYVLTSNGTTVTITPQSYTETASYVIFKVGSMYYAKNGSTGEIEFSGTDAATVIQSAIDATSEGGLVSIKQGIYTINTTYDTQIKITKTITVCGEGFGTILRFTGVGTDKRWINEGCTMGILMVLADNAVVRDLTVDGNNIEGINGIVAGYQYPTEYKNNIKIIHVKAINCRPHSSNNANGYGIYIGRMSYGHVVRDCHVENCYAGIVGCGYTSPVTAGRFWILNNYVKDTDYPAIYLKGCPNSMVIGNLVEDINHTGIWVGELFSTDYNYIVKNNIVRNCSREGINSSQNEHSVVEGNIVYENGYSGIYFGRYTRITKNIVFNNGQAGSTDAYKRAGIANVPTYGDFYGCVIRDNIVFDNQTSPTQDYGYYEGANLSPPNHLVDNYFNCPTNVSRYNAICKRNIGFVTENSGTATIANGDYFAHGLAGKPTTVTLTCMNATYDGVPVVVNCNYANTNSTHVCVSMYWTNGTAITTDLLVSYYVEYKP